jgi:hypothetical protein
MFIFHNQLEATYPAEMSSKITLPSIFEEVTSWGKG